MAVSSSATVGWLREPPGGDRLAGPRPLVQDEPDPDWLDRPEVRRGLAEGPVRQGRWPVVRPRARDGLIMREGTPG